MNSHSSLHRPLPLLVGCLLVMLVGSGASLSLAQDATETPGRGQPTATPTEPVTPVRVTPTMEPTQRSADSSLDPVTPTAVPTSPPRPTAAPTQPPLPTAAPLNPNPDPPDQGSSLPPLNPFPWFFHATMTHRSRLCPSEIDPFQAGLTVADLDAACTLKPMGNFFAISPEGPGTASHGLERNGAGLTFWAKPGAWHVWNNHMPGYDLVNVACASALPQLPKQFVPVNADLYPDMDLAVLFAQQITCTWYYHSAQPLSEMTVHAWQCPVGYQPLAADADPVADCATPLDGVKFSVIVPPDMGKETVGFWAVSGEAGPGAALFQFMPAPNLFSTYASMLPQNGMVISGCEGFGLIGAATLEQQVEPGVSLTCHWYYVPSS